MRVEIEHVIDETSKELYTFKSSVTHWKYTGIAYSFRDDKNDIWGDQWSDCFYAQAKEEADAVAIELTGEEFEYMSGNDYENNRHRFLEIHNKYNPVLLKTKHGKRRYSAESFGGQSPKPVPKLSPEALRDRILEVVSEMQVRL